MGKSKPTSTLVPTYKPAGKTLRDAYNYFEVFEKKIQINDTLYLRPVMEEDLSFFEEHFNQDYIQDNLYITTDKVETYINSLINTPEYLAYTIVEGKTKIGMINFKDLKGDFPNTTCWLSPSVQGKGIMALVKAGAYSSLKITKIYAEVYKTNIPSQKMAIKFGYKLVREDERQYVYLWEKK